MYDIVEKTRPIVQKYGGTSVGSRERILDVAERTSHYVRQGFEKLAIVVSAQSGETNRLIKLIHDINTTPPGDAYDMALAAGEQVSVALVSAALAARGVASEPLLAHQLGIVTDDFHSRARILSIQTSMMEKAWQAGKVPVIAGFQGTSSEGQITTLGRGGSDTSAVALAVALKASFCEINTDVDGLYSADPRVIPDARLLKTVDYEVALEMASLGSKVLHPRCVELGKKWSMPITVRNSFKSNDTPRTWIMNYREQQQLESPVVTGVSVDKDVLKVSVSGLTQDSQTLSDLFKLISEQAINVDIIVFDNSADARFGKLGFTAAESDRAGVERALSRLKEHRSASDLHWELKGDLAKVSIVGVGMRSHPGVAQKAFQCLANSNIEVKMISTSEIKVSCVVDRTKADDAARALHQQFCS